MDLSKSDNRNRPQLSLVGEQSIDESEHHREIRDPGAPTAEKGFCVVFVALFPKKLPRLLFNVVSGDLRLV